MGAGKMLDKEKRKVHSKSARAGLSFPVGRLARYLKKGTLKFITRSNFKSMFFKKENLVKGLD